MRVEVEKLEDLIQNWRNLIGGLSKDNIQVQAVEVCISDLEMIINIFGK